MYFFLKSQRESYKFWKENFKDNPNTPWTAEFSLGYMLTHYPIAYLEILLECFAFVLVVLFLVGK